MSLRQVLVKIYWYTNSILRHMIGSAIDEHYFRHRDPLDVRRGFANLVLPHREWLANRIVSGLKEMQHLKILEIGCGWGPNLIVLSRTDSTMELLGIDISPASVFEGRKRIMELGLENITLTEMPADNLNKFKTSSVDVVFTDAALLYIGPDKILQVVTDMLRVARRRVLILEMHLDTHGKTSDKYTKDGWVRDYMALLTPLVGENAIRLERLPEGLRSSGRWPNYGHLLEVNIEAD